MFAVKGFASLVRDGADAVSAGIKALESSGYIIRARKRDCLAAWERRVAQGFSPEQIVDAYAAYAKSYWMRNGDDARLAKSLVRWLEGEGGLTAYSDEPILPDLLDADGEPLDMVALAQADPDFAKLWRKVETRRSVIRSQLAMGGATPFAA